jgi:hypothetical protein
LFSVVLVVDTPGTRIASSAWRADAYVVHDSRVAASRHHTGCPNRVERQGPSLNNWRADALQRDETQLKTLLHAAADVIAFGLLTR